MLPMQEAFLWECLGALLYRLPSKTYGVMRCRQTTHFYAIFTSATVS